MNAHFDTLNQKIEPLREQIIQHALYQEINNLSDLQIFMKYHVFAVWDFMSLLKSLQINLTCVETPWLPVGNADTRFLINEIVVGEESDVDQNGIRTSHFELYLSAMKQAGANTQQINDFIDNLKIYKSLTLAFEHANVPDAIRSFVEHTFSIVNSNESYLQAAVFTFGREDLIPAMFLSMVNNFSVEESQKAEIFKYYLERHIEVDGDHHSHLALQMTSNLCGTDEQIWKEAEQATIEALQKRIDLWDAVYEQIMKNKK
jgi:hypothetical protein